jgi:hypothetical protein
MANKVIVYKDKTLEDLFEEIHKNSKQKNIQINGIIADMKNKVENMSDILKVAPILKDYIDVGVKNNEHIIKLTGIIQRLENAKATGVSDETWLSDLQHLLPKEEDTSGES